MPDEIESHQIKWKWWNRHLLVLPPNELLLILTIKMTKIDCTSSIVSHSPPADAVPSNSILVFVSLSWTQWKVIRFSFLLFLSKFIHDAKFTFDWLRWMWEGEPCFLKIRRMNFVISCLHCAFCFDEDDAVAATAAAAAVEWMGRTALYLINGIISKCQRHTHTHSNFMFGVHRSATVCFRFKFNLMRFFHRNSDATGNFFLLLFVCERARV